MLRDLVSQLALAAGVTGPRRSRRGVLLILTFHRVLPADLRAQYPLPGLAVTPEDLRWILRTLGAGFRILTVSDAVCRHREEPDGRPLLALSFDDGQLDNLEFAAPVLREEGVPATFYLPTDFIGRAELLWHDEAAFAFAAARQAGSRASTPQGDGGAGPDSGVGAFLARLKAMPPTARAETVRATRAAAGEPPPPGWARLMDWGEVQRLAAAGHEIGSHGCSHGLLPQMDPDAKAREFLESREAIQRMGGVLPRSMCYPNGSYDDECVALAERAGYENAVTTRWGANRKPADRFRLLRCDMDARRLLDRHGSRAPARLWTRLDGLQPGLR